MMLSILNVSLVLLELIWAGRSRTRRLNYAKVADNRLTI